MSTHAEDFHTPPRKILIATDAWAPQVNGVVRTFQTTIGLLRESGHTVEVIGPDRFRTVPAPGYPEVRLAIAGGRALAEMIETFRPDAIHIPVEGPIGLAARRYCTKRGVPFTTSFHTRFGEYFEKRVGGTGGEIAFAVQRWFHSAGAGIMVQTDTLERQLGQQGFRNIRRWGRGVDTELFHPYRDDPGYDPDFLDLPRPIFLYLGRVSKEKNLEAFLDLDLPGSKVIVGDGPAAAQLKQAYPKAHFLGYRGGEDLPRHFSAADVFVFSSRFETFGLVVLEALACGTPVAAFPVPGPLDILGDAPQAVLSEDLRAAAMAALAIDRQSCRRFAEGFSWQASTREFLSNLVPIPQAVWDLEVSQA